MDNSPTFIRSEENQEASEKRSCPICGERLMALPGQMRCVRCCFTLCVMCEGEPVDA